MRGDRLSVDGERVFNRDHSEIDALRAIKHALDAVSFLRVLEFQLWVGLVSSLMLLLSFAHASKRSGDHLPTSNDVSFFVTFTTARGALVEL